MIFTAFTERTRAHTFTHTCVLWYTVNKLYVANVWLSQAVSFTCMYLLVGIWNPSHWFCWVEFCRLDPSLLKCELAFDECVGFVSHVCLFDKVLFCLCLYIYFFLSLSFSVSICVCVSLCVCLCLSCSLSPPYLCLSVSLFVAICSYFIFTSFWQYKVYYVFGFMMLVFLIMIVVTVCVTIVCAYFLLNSEDYRW